MDKGESSTCDVSSCTFTISHINKEQHQQQKQHPP